MSYIHDRGLEIILARHLDPKVIPYSKTVMGFVTQTIIITMGKNIEIVQKTILKMSNMAMGVQYFFNYIVQGLIPLVFMPFLIRSDSIEVSEVIVRTVVLQY